MKDRPKTFRTLKPLEEARQLFLSRFSDCLLQPELVPVRNALGRVLVHAVKAARSVPAYSAAAVDGMAVRAAATFPACPESPVFLRAGEEAVHVDTGDPLPKSTDAVVMIEKVELAGDRCEIRSAVYPWQNVRKAGEDMVKGEILLPAHHRIRPYDQGALLAGGILSAEVFRKPRVLVIPTGNEIVQPEEAGDLLKPGVILEANGQVLASMVQECGGEAALSRIVPDQLASIKDAVNSALDAGYDLVLIIAGSSMGSEDFTPAALSELGELLVHGVAVMPGKPTLLASVRERPVIGVPGYPVSAVICFREFIRPLLYRMQGIALPENETIEAVMGRKLPSKAGFEEHIRVIVGKVGERHVAIPLAGGAGMMTPLVRADGILPIPRTVSGYSEGDTVRIQLLTPEHVLDQKLLAIGSHDLTIDLLASMLKERSEGRFTISSSNVGSLGGLLALERGTAHFAGSHLLDTETGDYNRTYVRRYVTRTPVTLMTLVHRWQGLITGAGNPLGISSIADLTRSGITFINRQAGSGTRILLDDELRKAGIAAASIAGYRAEEYTHMSVAVAVASGRAHVGLGILAAAKALGLDFIPIARERYDLVIPTALLDDERMRLVVDLIRSPEFAEQILALGGYEVTETGKLIVV